MSAAYTRFRSLFVATLVFPPESNDRMAATPRKENYAKIFKLAVFDSDDAAFVDSFRAGDRHAQAELYRRYATHIERVLYRVLGWDEEVLELVQEVFLRAIAGKLHHGLFQLLGCSEL